MLIGGVKQSQAAAQGIAPQTAESGKNTAQHISEQVKDAVEDFVEISFVNSKKAKEEENGKWDLARFMEQLENAKAQGEAMGDMLDERIKCLQIAMRIMAGDKVPLEDMRFLAEKDPDLYARSILMKRQNADPKKWKRLTEDKEDEGDKACGCKESVGSCGEAANAPGHAEAAQPAAEAAPAETGGRGETATG